MIDFIDQTEEVLFDIDIKHKINYYAIDEDLSKKLNTLAYQKGIKPSYLINVLLKEKLEKADYSNPSNRNCNIKSY